MGDDAAMDYLAFSLPEKGSLVAETRATIVA
jgi:hypothetical protein